ncbi:class I SAM-dependent DNA methyltransferase [Phaeobacter marinintestinus]|uniref:class I SAM-dependent DNA methyltransferase n=1 Tax=Falsiphaeobacter marinintestinus TaxID=1492905 RepID=UPI0011B70805|nr:methyltransferase domain-containing protein [Phaeobacter marinintestinus]
MNDGFLSQAYSARDTASMRQLYDDWATTYEAELTKNGYATPGRCAVALAANMQDLTLPVLDFGCGTGLSGKALVAEGFTTLDGMDLSGDMLKGAESKGIYRTLKQIDGETPPDIVQGDYAAIAAIGVIGGGAAPIGVFDMLMDRLGSGGRMVLSFNDHALEDPENEGHMADWCASGRARVLFREHGDHIPGINLRSTVYVLERL